MGGCVAMSASAQETKQSQDLSVELNPVVVTGTGTHHRLKDTPTPVEVVTANDIKKAGITDFREAMTALVPSLSFSTNSMGDYLMLNGLSNKYVLILINGKKLTGDSSNNIDLNRIDMSNVKRIEVLKGAGSALYGSDAIGGVINIITNQPINDITVTSNTKVEERGQFTQTANADIKTKKFASYTSYQRRQADGWTLTRVDADGEARDKHDANAFYTDNYTQMFQFTPNDKLSMYVEGSYYDRTVKRQPEYLKYNLTYDAYSLGAGAKYNFNKRSYIQFDIKNDNYDTNYLYTNEDGDNKVGDEVRQKRQHYYSGNLKSLFRFTENTRTIFGVEYTGNSGSTFIQR